ncbi:kinetochore Spc7 family protein [Caballeronia glebae]|uniref:hypothetical protein n=1 Tax=Caballeronia glebae TaxID=1777143 RepID=UPI0038B910A3
MDIGSISAALGSTKAVIDLAKTALAARDDAKLAEAIHTLNERIFEIQNAALQLQEKASAARDEIESLKDGKRQLSARIAELEHQRSERESYDLHELSEGVFVLAEVNPPKNGRNPHYLCQSCMHNSAKKGVLKRGHVSFQYVLSCPICKNDYPTGEYINIGV